MYVQVYLRKLIHHCWYVVDTVIMFLFATIDVHARWQKLTSYLSSIFLERLRIKIPIIQFSPAQTMSPTAQQPRWFPADTPSFHMTSHGVRVYLPLIRRRGDATYALAVLACQKDNEYSALLLHRINNAHRIPQYGTGFFGNADDKVSQNLCARVLCVPRSGEIQEPPRWAKMIGFAFADLSVEWTEFYVSHSAGGLNKQIRIQFQADITTKFIIPSWVINRLASKLFYLVPSDDDTIPITQVSRSIVGYQELTLTFARRDTRRSASKSSPEEIFHICIERVRSKWKDPDLNVHVGVVFNKSANRVCFDERASPDCWESRARTFGDSKRSVKITLSPCSPGDCPPTDNYRAFGIIMDIDIGGTRYDTSVPSHSSRDSRRKRH